METGILLQIHRRYDYVQSYDLFGSRRANDGVRSVAVGTKRRGDAIGK